MNIRTGQLGLDLQTEIAIRNQLMRIQETQKLLTKQLQDLDVLVQDYTDEKGVSPEAHP